MLNSRRFRAILGIILKVGNRLNTAGSSTRSQANAITLDSLLKLNQVKAFDKKTTFLKFLVKTVRQNKASLVHFKEEMPSVSKVERSEWAHTMDEMKRIERGLDEVRRIALQESKAAMEGRLSMEEEVEVLRKTTVGRFTLDACVQMTLLAEDFEKANEQFNDLIQFFGEISTDSEAHPDVVFSILRTFGKDFDRALNEVILDEKMKVSTAHIVLVFCSDVDLTLLFASTDASNQRCANNSGCDKII